MCCRNAHEETVIGEQIFELDKTLLDNMLQQSKTELESKRLVCIVMTRRTRGVQTARIGNDVELPVHGWVISGTRKLGWPGRSKSHLA